MKQTRILIADDHPVFRRGLRAVIEAETNLTVVGEAENGEQALSLIEKTDPDIVILDVDMPVMDGVETSRIIYARFPLVKTMFLTLHRESQLYNSLVDLNVKGYILKDSALQEIIDGIGQIVAGGTYISPQISNSAFWDSTDHIVDSKAAARMDTLTSSEAGILKLVAQMMSSKEIAEKLYISVRTVDNHRFNICNKLQLSGNHALLKFALANRTRILKDSP